MRSQRNEVMKGSEYVLMLPKWYPNKMAPNEGNYVADHIRAISRKQLAVVCYVHSEKRDSPKGSYLEVSSHEKLFIYRSYFKRYNHSIKVIEKIVNSFRYFQTQIETYRRIRHSHGKPVLIHVHILLRTMPLALFLKSYLRIPLVVSEHWSLFLPEQQDEISIWKKMLIRWTMNQADQVTCVSRALAHGLKEVGLKKEAVVIYNALDTSVFKPENQNLAKNKFKFIHISRQDDAIKNAGGIIEVCRRLSEKRSDFEMHFAGKGMLTELQMKRSEDQGLLNKIIYFHGYLSSIEVAKLLNEGDALVMFSNYETQCKVILEAFACGKPVIATSVGGIPELMTEGRGILISSGDEEQLEDAMRSMMDEKFTFQKPAGLRNFVIEHASYESVENRFREVYNGVL